ncbi:RWD domain-containing protein 3 [Astyanax mexicanus]|uniref:RWD domain-containing protein 3 n=2 Tax=Astyanax mexicanus TaxID=7994 RepID=A0A8B9R9U1_ASTMX|nr:RWD domain-containing protein 3 [Astyanax mexicanus]KAG9264796.1 RWD domain-containing protein 3 [Astyanax mexicanus]
MSEEVLDELAVLSAIYCGEEEFQVVGESAETGLVYRINTVVESEEKKTPLSLVFQLSPEYPHTPPDVSISSNQLSRKQCQELRDGLLNKACSLQPRPMVHELVLWLQQNFSDLLTTSAPNTLKAQSTADGSAEGMWTALLHLDHMRSKTKYIRLIEKWTSELGLTGRLLMGKAIFILLQGERKSIKEYIHLQRTVKVDVDSSGKRCKEKMMSVLCEIPLSDDFKKISTFEVRDPLSSEELKKEFEEVGSLKLHQEFVSSLL